jgi:hypothetical protein
MFGGGIVFGLLGAFVSRFFWLIILFPIGLGVCAGVLLSVVITKYHIRHPLLAVAAAIGMGVIIYTTMQYGN